MDIYVVQGTEGISNKIRRLITSRYGSPYKKARTHIECQYDDTKNISAEGRGVMLVDPGRLKRFTRYRFKNITAEQRDAHRGICDRFLGKRYGYGRYALDFANISLAVIPLLAVLLVAINAVAGAVGLFAGWFAPLHVVSLYSEIGLSGLALLLLAAKPVAKYFDRRTFDCTELVSEILKANGLWIPSIRSRDEYPDGMEQVLKNLCHWGIVEVVDERN